jgi:hypothetical protein
MTSDEIAPEASFCYDDSNDHGGDASEDEESEGAAQCRRDWDVFYGV